MKPDRRGSWYLLTGAVVGVILGLVYSWVISPVKYVDAPPYALRADYKDDYRALVASAYLYNNDLLRAEGRLVQLKDDDTVQTLTLQAQRALVEGQSDEEVRALASLASDLGARVTPESLGVTSTPDATSMPTYTSLSPTPVIIDPTASPTMTLLATSTVSSILFQITTNTPLPTRTSTSSPTPGGTFVMKETQMVCDVKQPTPLIQVEIRDAAGQPVPSMEVIVKWEGGQDHFFTGLQPEVGLGYGDFVMTPGVIYSVHLADGGQPVNDLIPVECTAQDGSQYWGSWYLVFVQP